MQIFLDNNQVIRLWKIRCELVKKLRDLKFLSQSFLTLILMSFAPWFMSGFDPRLRSKYILVAVTLSTMILLIFSFLYYVKKNTKLRKHGKMPEVLLILIYDITSLGWLSWIFTEMGINHLENVTYFSESTQTGIKLTILGMFFATVVVTFLFSAPILQWHIRQREELKGNQKKSNYTSILISVGVGIGVLLLNFPFSINGVYLSGIVVYFLGTLVISGIVFTATTNSVELAYYLSHRTILNAQFNSDIYK